jgi:hypothetical protein
MNDPLNADERFGDRRPNVACPGCGFTPFFGQQWVCAPDGCGGSFDTFETQARCPHCEAQFAWTECPVCARASAHRSWYTRSARAM